MPVLEADERISKVVGVARRPFDPAAHGWSKLEYRQGDVRDVAVLEEAFAGADIVVHLAFLITGTRNDPNTHAINIDGTLNVFHAAAKAGAKRFVYASSVSAYGFASDLPIGITEDRPVKGAAHNFYSQEKAELEERLAALAAVHPSMELYVLRPPGVLGPNMMGAKSDRVAAMVPKAHRVINWLRRHRPPIPMIMPYTQMQLIHESDVGTAFLQCIVGAGPAGAYNISGDGLIDASDILREMGLRPIVIRSHRQERLMRWLARQSTRRFVPDGFEFAEMLTVPVIVDTTKAHEQLDWKPRWTSLEVLRGAVTGHH